MRTLTIVLISACCVLYTKQQTTDRAHPNILHEYKIACAKENGVLASEAGKIWADPEYFANNRDMKCYYACVWVKAGLINNGKFDSADLTKMFGHFKSSIQLNQIKAKCADVPPNRDQCELAYQIVSCAAKAALG